LPVELYTIGQNVSCDDFRKKLSLRRENTFCIFTFTFKGSFVRALNFAFYFFGVLGLLDKKVGKI